MKLSLAQALLISSTSAGGLTMYEHYGNGGWAKNFGEGNHDIHTFPNDKVSSIKVDNGCCARFFQHAGFQGKNFQACATTKNVPANFNDQISSVKVECSEPLTMYQHYGFGGWSKNFGVGNHDIHTFKNDDVSSFKVGKGCCAKFYQHAGFKGKVHSVCDKSENVPADFNDVISSVNVTCPGSAALEEDLTEDLDVSMSRYAGDRLEQKFRKLRDIQREMERPDRQRREAMAQEFEQMQKDVFGWTFEQKMKELNPEKRYMPLIGEIMRSAEFKAKKEFDEHAVSDPAIRKIIQQAEWVGRDVFGGCGRNGCSRGIEGDEYRSRPGPEESKDMSRSERGKLEIEGVRIDNDDLKDAMEDAENLFESVDDLFNPESRLMAEEIKLDAALRWSPNVQKLVKMVMNDFGIKSEKDFEKTVEDIAERIGEKLENSHYLERAHLAAERVMRTLAKSLKISDLPTGKRMKWVNGLAKRLNNIMQSEDPASGAEDFVGDVLEDFAHEVEEWMVQVEAIEQSLKPTF